MWTDVAFMKKKIKSFGEKILLGIHPGREPPGDCTDIGWDWVYAATANCWSLLKSTFTFPNLRVFLSKKFL